ncbi:MAG: aminodeoxychorismate/anthranilate synthase component II [Alphaproteobacteria bacterium]|nr:MAG: aminodeoxychorismate/anthranilate synthase component II [Alphaproteobacteria bacterium]
MIVLIDNYDSFTFNLFHYLGGLGADVVVYRNDKIAADQVVAMEPEAIVLSPGPRTPRDAGICLELIAKAATAIPLLGVCLGHQAIGEAYGGAVVRAPMQVHGKLSEIMHQGGGIFRGINAPFKATRYHSLVVERARVRPSHAAELSRHRRRLERREGPPAGRRSGEPPSFVRSQGDRRTQGIDRQGCDRRYAEPRGSRPRV